MLHCFDPIRDMTFWAILARLTLAVVCGGLIGAEREIKRRPAGFRTHILICLGSAITTLTSQYLLFQHLYNDIARLGAQVISGIGFVGAGTIIVTRDKRVKGLTTAAGLWAAAIIGLVCGAGYVECAIFATAVVLLVMQVGGSGGTFPIEMTGPVFQAIYPFLPFTHGINAMHAAMAGAYHMEYWIELGILASYLIPSLALGVVFRRPVIKANDWIIEKLESTKLI